MYERNIYSQLQFVVVDVDGTLTDGGIYYDNDGNELKKFCTKDAAGFFAAKACGIKTIIITGRECSATLRRMQDLQADFVFQGVKEKRRFLQDFMVEKKIIKEQLGYIGDDLNDLGPMRLAGFVACPADSCKEIKDISNYISSIPGGHGAVRDVFEHVLRNSGQWERAVEEIYSCGV